MKILIDIGHPAHIHYFKELAKYFLKNNHTILFTIREKEVVLFLIRKYNFDYISFGSGYESIFGKIFGYIKFSARLFFVALKLKPDLIINATPYSSIAAFFLRIPHISLEDTFNMEQVRLYKPFTSVILTGDYQHPSLGEKEIRYKGYHELAYLHPNYFNPNKTVLEDLGVKENDKYVIIRFVSWQATHDAGHKGISFENKIKAVKEFEKYAKVFISSESVLPPELERNRIKIEPHRMHDAISFATLVIGESFTMLSEAAVTGTPAVLVHDTKCYYLQEQQHKYGLVFNYTESEADQLKAIEKGVEILQTLNIKQQWQEKRKRMLADKIDVTAFMVWFVENYPESVRVMREKPEYQNRFR